jgi:hypothetical protein
MLTLNITVTKFRQRKAKKWRKLKVNTGSNLYQHLQYHQLQLQIQKLQLKLEQLLKTLENNHNMIVKLKGMSIEMNNCKYQFSPKRILMHCCKNS